MTKTIANSVPFITEVLANLQHFRTSTKVWEWASRTTNRCNYYIFSIV